VTGPEIPEGAVKLHAIGEAYSDVAMVEESLPRMALSAAVIPVVQLPLKPPPARSNYMPGVVGGLSAASALNFSNVGLFNDEDFSRVIVRCHAISITNRTAGAVTYDLRRLDVVTGFTFDPYVPAYSDAGVAAGTAVGRLTRNNSAASLGVNITALAVEANRTEIFPFKGILNDGAFLVSSGAINEEVFAQFWFHVYPIIQPQLSG